MKAVDRQMDREGSAGDHTKAKESRLISPGCGSGFYTSAGLPAGPVIVFCVHSSNHSTLPLTHRMCDMCLDESLSELEHCEICSRM